MNKVSSVCLALLVAAPASAATARDEKIYAAAQANRAASLDLLRDIVNIDSGTGDAAGGTKVNAVLAARLKELGATIRYEPASAPDLPDSLIADFHGSGKGRILVIAHIDTVFGPGTAARRPFRIDGDRAYGPGAGDEKAGVVNAITALKILHDTGFKDFDTITLLLDTSEERSTPDTKLIRALAAPYDVELNMEPGDPPDDLTVWRKGSTAVQIQVKGRAAHAGMAPQNGRNAAVELIHQLDGLAGAFPLTGDGVTLNLTMLKAGERSNIIPEYAEATFSLRIRKPEQREQVLAKMRAVAAATVVPDTVVTVTAGPGYPPLIEDPDVDALAGRAQAIYAELGKSINKSGNGGSSESALAQSVGTPALDGLGPVGGDFHTDHEWVDLNSLTPRLYLLTRLLMDVGANPPAPKPGK
jgi:glutamate carboxypeptidase